MSWYPFDNGASLGLQGSEDEIIIADDEHEKGARITIEKDGNIAPFSLTCGIYGWMMHTRFFSSDSEAKREASLMKMELLSILQTIAREIRKKCNQQFDKVTEQITTSIQKFP